jgi:hypothetical protein
MTRDETIALFMQGKEAWNAWAEKMLAERKAMEADGRWAAEKNAFGSLEPKNNETRGWMNTARADFSRCFFLVRGAEEAKEAEPKKNGNRTEETIKVILVDEIDFSGFIFPGDANFLSAAFSGHAGFDNAAFNGYSTFESAAFKDRASFESTAFEGEAVFGVATFSSTAIFDHAMFKGDARFDIVIFNRLAVFRRVTFGGDAFFASAAFQNFTNFQGAKFSGEADFIGINVDRVFDMSGAKFAHVPAFNQANFKQAPDLDYVMFPLPSFWWADASLISQYRAIRRMAIQGADYEREQMAFKCEIRSKRATEHRWYHAAFWYGLAHDAFSDFGRSMSRPLALWLFSIVLFAGAYLISSGKVAREICLAADASNFDSALVVSWRNALPFVGIDPKADRVASECLYGASVYGDIAIQGRSKNMECRPNLPLPSRRTQSV